MSFEEITLYPSATIPRIESDSVPFGRLQKLVSDVAERHDRAALDRTKVRGLSELIITRAIDVPRDVILLREAKKTLADFQALLALGKPIDQLMMVRLSEAQRVISDIAQGMLPKG